MRYLTADFGSTYTKLTAIDTDTASVVGTSTAFTTIETDVMDGFRSALSALADKIGAFDYDRLLCCSSAADGGSRLGARAYSQSGTYGGIECRS